MMVLLMSDTSPLRQRLFWIRGLLHDRRPPCSWSDRSPRCPRNWTSVTLMSLENRVSPPVRKVCINSIKWGSDVVVPQVS